MKKLALIVFGLCLTFTKITFAEQPLPVDQAFRFSYQLSSDQKLNLHWQIAPNYYLYREHFQVTATNSQVKLDQINLPAGINKEDELLGKYQVYAGQLDLQIPILQAQPGLQKFSVRYQGCSALGFCYPPVTKDISVKVTQAINSANQSTSLKKGLTDTSHATQLLENHSGWLMLLGFFGFGLLLALTPCVWPMIPILSSIIIGQGSQITTNRAFWLSLTYVLSMAMTYAGAGVLAAMAGSYLQASLQNPWVIGTFSILFILLALALFDCYTLQLPFGLQERLNNINTKQQGGTYLGVAFMGCLSVLIVSPCVSAPLVGALAYIGKTGDRWLGGSALFALGLGMGLPLLIMGTLGGTWLPKAGGWMATIKALFGFLLLAIAVSLLQRIVPDSLGLILWASLALGCSIYLNTFSTTSATIKAKLGKGLGIFLFIYSILLFIAAANGNANPLQPLANLGHLKTMSTQSPLNFQRVDTIDDVMHALQQAQESKQTVMLDFYADWCIACKHMERTTFNHPQVQKALQNMLLLRADVSNNSSASKALEQRFNVVAPPTILFFSHEGKEINSSRIVGEVDANTFLLRLPK